MMLGRLVLATLCAAAAWLPDPAWTAEAGDEPRIVFTAPGQKATDGWQVVIKFREGTQTRGEGSRFRIGEAGAVDALASALSPNGLTLAALRRLHARPAEVLDAERSRAMAQSGRTLADLNLYYVVRVPAGQSAAVLAERLSQLPVVEFAELQQPPAPPPEMADAATPNLGALQGYRAAPPYGLGALDPGQTPGGDGAGTTLVDVEYDWIFDHEDLDLPSTSVIDEAQVQDPFPDSEADHGTASLGVVAGKRNGIGVTGIAPAARLLVAPVSTEEFGYNLPRAIGLATGRLGPGDVLLLEQQMPVCETDYFGPVEWAQPVWDAIATATALGIIVIEPAGNGPINLDRLSCAGRFDRDQRDSRAIIVGAGRPGSRDRAGPSAYGRRIDVQGWGTGVASAGFGDAFDPGDPRRRYTANFSGTSSAAAMVAGAVLSIQGALKAQGLGVASPVEMRRALTLTGTAQSGADPIGPQVNIAAALAWLRAQRGAGPAWQAWESLGGTLAASEPECMALGSAGIDCWARSSRGTLAWWRYRAGKSGGPVDLGGTPRSAPSCLQAVGMLHCFAADPARGLAHTFLRDGSWRGWIARGGLLATRPSCLSGDGTGIDCVVLEGGRLRHLGIANGLWKSWAAVSTAPAMRDPPTCFFRAGGLDCLTVGTDSRVYWVRRQPAGNWSGPKNLGGVVRGRASCLRTGSTPTCFFRGNDNRLKRIIHDGTRWSGWSDLGGALASDPSCVLLRESGPSCFTASGNGSLMEWTRLRLGKPGWRSLGGSIAASRPACVAPSDNAVDCFAVGRDAHLQHLAYR
jgi:hypothetical protein